MRGLTDNLLHQLLCQGRNSICDEEFRYILVADKFNTIEGLSWICDVKFEVVVDLDDGRGLLEQLQQEYPERFGDVQSKCPTELLFPNKFWLFSNLFIVYIKYFTGRGLSFLCETLKKESILEEVDFGHETLWIHSSAENLHSVQDKYDYRSVGGWFIPLGSYFFYCINRFRGDARYEFKFLGCTVNL